MKEKILKYSKIFGALLAALLVISSICMVVGHISWGRATWFILMYLKVFVFTSVAIIAITEIKPFTSWKAPAVLMVLGFIFTLVEENGYEIFGHEYGFEASDYAVYVLLGLVAVLSMVDVRFGLTLLLASAGSLVYFFSPEAYYWKISGIMAIPLVIGWFIGFLYRTLRKELY